MDQIRYYRIESDSLEKASSIGKELTKFVLDRKMSAAQMGLTLEELAQIEGGEADSTAITPVLYDSGQFRVMYCLTQELEKPKKALISRKIISPGKYSTELIISAEPQDVLRFQDFLRREDFTVYDAKQVTSASWCFTDSVEDDSFVIRKREEIIQSLTRAPLKITQGIQYSFGSYVYRLTGSYSGDITTVLETRDRIRKRFELIHDTLTFS